MIRDEQYPRRDRRLACPAKGKPSGTRYLPPVLRKPPPLEPPIEFLDPVIPGGPLLPHSKSVPTRRIYVDLRLVAGRSQGLIKLHDGLLRHFVVLRPRHKNRRQVRGNRRHQPKRPSINRRGKR